MKKIILFICTYIVSIFSSVSVFAAAEENIEQTGDFIWKIFDIFSVDMAMKLAFAVIVMVFTFIISKIVREKLFGYLERSNIWDDAGKEEVIGVISRTVNIIILITGFSLVLGVLGIDLWIFMWGIWFGIGFTLRTFLTNFISWVIVVTQGSYHVGDLIEVGSKTWKIVKINALFTSMEELDGVTFNIPNVRFFEENVRNFHTNDKRRLDIDVVVAYGTDIVQAKKILQKVISNFPTVLQAPAPDILIKNLGERWVGLQLRFWIHSKESFFKIQSNITETVNLAFEQTGITIPYPQMTVSGKLDK